MYNAAEGKTLALLEVMRENNYIFFRRPFELNIIGVRSNVTSPERFDDEINVLYRDHSGALKHCWFKATTDPGTYWLKAPMVEKGTAILKQGQYKNAYALGLHRGLYKALVQRNPVTIMRDYDRDAVLDFFNGNIEAGLFGINIHRAAAIGESYTVDKYSAGCQVFAEAEDFEFFIRLCDVHESLYGNRFTYTLVDERAVARKRKRYLLYGAAGLAGIVTATAITGK